MRRYLFLLLSTFLFLPPHAVWAADTAEEVIDNFYREYLTTDPTDRMKRRPPFSQAFLHDEALDKKACEQYAGTDICGWDADFNPYLNAQDYSDKLTYDNAAVAVSQTKPNTVSVTLNIFPGQEGVDNLRTITYQMTKEHENWVVDNIVADAGEGKKPFMARRVMLNEIAYYQNKVVEQ